MGETSERLQRYFNVIFASPEFSGERIATTDGSEPPSWPRTRRDPLLGGVGIGVEMISQGASRVNLSFVVRGEDADRAVRLLHRGIGLDAEVPASAGTATK